MPSPWLAIGLVLAVVVVSLLLRRPWGDKQLSGPAPAPPPPAFEEEDDEEEEEEEEDSDLDEADEVTDPAERVPVTAEGMALVRTGHQVTLVPLVRSDEIPDWLRSGIEDSTVPYQVVNEFYGMSARATQGARAAMTLAAGDFTAVRIRRDTSAAAWRLETLGRDGDFGFFPFETQSGATLAKELLERLGIVQVHLDDDRNPIPHSPEDFEEARRRYDETERALALESDPGEALPPGDYSDRR